MIDVDRFKLVDMTADELYAACQMQRRQVRESRRDRARLVRAAVLRIAGIVALLAAAAAATFLLSRAVLSTDAALIAASIGLLLALWRLEPQLQATAAVLREVRRAADLAVMHASTLAAAEGRLRSTLLPTGVPRGD